MDISSEFIHWALWRTLMKTNFFFCSPQAFWLSSAPGTFSTLVTSVVLYLVTRATLVGPGQDKTHVCGTPLMSPTDGESHWWVLGRTKQVSMDIYVLNLFIEHFGDHWWEQNIFCLFTTPEAFWQSSAPVVLFSLTRATLMSPGKDETRACGYIYIYIYIYWYINRWIDR